MATANPIEELNFLDEVELVEMEYLQKTGLHTIKLSDWNSSREFKAQIMHELNMPKETDPIDYIFLIL